MYIQVILNRIAFHKLSKHKYIVISCQYKIFNKIFKIKRDRRTFIIISFYINLMVNIFLEFVKFPSTRYSQSR